jgi:DNA-binding NarL/FixJ family response regulator
MFDERQSQVGQASASAPPVAFYIDKQPLWRDCVGQQLASHLPEWVIEPVASIREVQENWSGASLIILHARGASSSAPEIAEEIGAIAEIAPGVPLVFMSDLTEPAEVHRVMQFGARGFLSADLSFAQVVAAIRFVGQGGTFIPPCVLAASTTMQPTSPVGPTDSNGKTIQFSPRQWKVLERLKQGKQNKIIAYELCMCESTVKVHIRNIMKKLKVRNRTQVVILANNADYRPAETFAA